MFELFYIRENKHKTMNGFFHSQKKSIKDIKMIRHNLDIDRTLTKVFVEGEIRENNTFFASKIFKFAEIKFKIDKIKKREDKNIIVDANTGQQSLVVKILNAKKAKRNKEYKAFGYYHNNEFIAVECYRLVPAYLEVKNIIYNNEDTFMCKAKIEFKSYDNEESMPETNAPVMKGRFANLIESDEMKVVGFWRDTPKGMIFEIDEYERTFSGGEKAVVNFIKFTVNGVGKKTIEKIVAKFGSNTIKTIKENHMELTSIKGINEEKAKLLHDKVHEAINLQRVFKFLLENDVSESNIVKIFKNFAGGAIEKIKENPYCILEIHGMHFIVADKIAMNLGKRFNSLDRIKASIMSFLGNETQNKGDLFTYKHELYEEINEYAKKKGVYKEDDEYFTTEQISQAIKSLNEDKKIFIENRINSDDNEVCIYKSYNRFLEVGIVNRLYELLTEFKTPMVQADQIEDFVNHYESKYKLKFAKRQKEAIYMATKNGVSILTGGPGTGKTQTINSIIKCIEYVNPYATIELCAPTGKASKRMSELTNMDASTIHRKIKYIPFDNTVEMVMIESDYVIIDESSMIDADLFYKLLLNISEDTRILFVGDHEQLPSVGAGLILRDLIKSDTIPVTVLNEIFRQSQDSKIVQVAYDIIHGKTTADGLNLDESKDFKFIEEYKVSDIKPKMNEEIKKLINEEGFKFQDIQILTPTNKGELGTFMLNNEIQAEYNENTNQLQVNVNKLFKVSDKVMQTKNNYDLDVFNGSVGYVTDIFLGNNGYEITVDYDGVDVIYDDEFMDELILAYATTVHKSQGSEYPVIIIPIHSEHDFMNNRNLIYTAVTRAKAKIIFIGMEEALNQAILKTDNTKRNSQIIERLRIKFNKVA